MLWKKENGIKYTEMCMFIDENVPKIVNPGENPDLENKIYNYLWLLVKALAIKKCMFTDFKDYDMYAFYSANRLFFALRKNQLNQGKVIKGKLIRPIKSCLNYTKALLYPMKIEYQRESYREIIEEEFVSKKFDAFTYQEQLKNDVKADHKVSLDFYKYLKDVFSRTGLLLDRILEKSPFKRNSQEYTNLKISLLLSSLHILKTKQKLILDNSGVVLWHLPKSMTGYIKVLLKEFFMEIKREIMDCYKVADMDDSTLECILQANTQASLGGINAE